MREKPSNIDRQLIGKADVRAKAVELAIDYGLTVEEFMGAIQMIGVKVSSRSAAARWRVRQRPAKPGGPISQLAAAIIAKVITLRGKALVDLAKHLGVRLDGAR